MRLLKHQCGKQHAPKKYKKRCRGSVLSFGGRLKYLLLTTFLLLKLITASSQIIISEFGINPGGGQTEFIELYNKSGCSIDISCYTLVFSSTSGTNNATGWTIKIPTGSSIAACKTFLIGGKSGTGGVTAGTGYPTGGASTSYSGTNGISANVDLGSSSVFTNSVYIKQSVAAGSFPNTSGQLTLLDASGNVLSSVSYNNGTASGNNSATYPLSSYTTCNSSNNTKGTNNISDPGSSTNHVNADFSKAANRGIIYDGTSYVSTSNLTPGDEVNKKSNNSTVTLPCAPSTTATISGTGSICAGTTTSVSVALTGTSPWSLTYTNGSTSTTTTNITTSPYTISVSPTTTTTYSLTSISDTYCTGTVSGNATITVNNNSTITLTSLAATTSQTVCISTAITNITYSVGGGGTGASVTGLPSGVSGSYNSGTKMYTITGTPTASGTYNYTVTTTGPCSNPSLSGSFTVNTNSTIALTSVAATTSQTVCSGTAITDITYFVGGGGTGASVTGLPSGVTGSYNSGTKIFTIAGTPTATGTFNYTVTTTGPCTNPSLSGTITVKSLSVAPTSVSATSSSICSGTSTTLTVIGGSLGTNASWKWYTTSCGGTLVGTGSSISVSPTTATTYYVRAEGDCNTTSCASISITLKTNSTDPTSATFAMASTCPGASVTLSVNGGSLGTNASWKWYSSSCGGTLIGTGSSISVTPSSSTTYYVRAEGDCNTTSCVSVTVVKGTTLVNYSYEGQTIGSSPPFSPISTASGVTSTQTVSANISSASIINDGTVTGPSAFTTNAPSSQSIQADIKGQTDPYFQYQISGLSSYKNYFLYFQFKPSNQSFSGSIQLQYSTSGTNGSFTPVANFTISSANNTWTEEVVDLTSITAINNQSTLYFRFVFPGNNNGQPVIEFDNFQFLALNQDVVNATATGVNASCSGAPDGMITISNTSTGTWQYSDDGGSTWQSSNVFSGLAAGTYDVRMRYTNNTACTVIINSVVITSSGTYTTSITASGATTFCSGGSVTLTASPGSSYVWSTGATSQSISASISGSYTVTVTSAAGCVATATTVVTVNALPTATINASGATTFCSGGSVTLTASSGAGYTYLWSTSATTQAINVSASGSYTVTVTNSSNCSATSAATVVTVNAKPTVTVSPNVTICSGNSTILTASGATSYLWNPSAGLSTTTASNVTANPTSTITYTVLGTDSNGCSNTANVIVTVNALPTISGASFSVCVGSTITLTGSPAATNPWSSSNPLIASVDASTGVVTGIAAGTTTITYTDSNNCTQTQTITVNAKPSPIIYHN